MDFIVTRWLRLFRTARTRFSLISAARRAFCRSSANLFVLAAICFASSSAADEDIGLIRFDIPANTLAVALVDFAMQADIQVIGRGDLLSQVQSNSLQGQFTLESGLGILLICSGFDAVIRNGSVHIRAAPLARSEGRCPASGAHASIATNANLPIWPCVSASPRFFAKRVPATDVQLAYYAAGWRGAS